MASEKRRAYMKAYNKQYYGKNKDLLLPKIRKRVAIWQQNNKEKRAEYAKRKVRDGSSKNSYYARVSRMRFKLQVIEAYGGCCSCCGEEEPEFLTLDHINGGGRQDRASRVNGGGDSWRQARKLDYPDKFRLLCFNCNFSAYLGGGICAHQRGGE